MALREKAKELAKAVMQTREFRELRNAKKEVDANSELKAKIEHFSKKQAEIFRITDPARLEENLKRLNSEYSHLSRHPEAKIFFEAVKTFNTLMAKTYKMVNDFIDSDLP